MSHSNYWLYEQKKMGEREKKLHSESGISVRLTYLREKCFGSRGKQRFAKELGIPLSSYATYEAGRTPPPELLVKVSEVTGCDLGWLMTGKLQALPKASPDPEMEDILTRMEQLISSQPKAKEAVRALMDVLAGGAEAVKQAETQTAKSLPAAVFPILGRAAAGLPAFWLDEKTETPVFDRMLNEYDPQKIMQYLPLPLIEASPPYSNKGDAQIFQLADPVDVGGLSVSGFLRVGHLEGKGKLLAMRIDGKSMEPVLHEGDLVIADTGQPAQAGQIALVEVVGGVGAVCKLFFPEKDHIRISPINRECETADIPPHLLRYAFRVIGVVKQRQTKPLSGW